MLTVRRTPSFIYRIWPYLPERLQSLLLFLGSPKVTLGAAAVIVDRHGRILLAHHTYRRYRQWDLPGGLLGKNEQPADGLARELLEELNVGTEIGPPLHARLHGKSRHHTVYYPVSLRGLPRPNGSEIDECRFVAIDDLPQFTGEVVPEWLRRAVAPSIGGHVKAVG